MTPNPSRPSCYRALGGLGFVELHGRTDRARMYSGEPAVCRLLRSVIQPTLWSAKRTILHKFVTQAGVNNRLAPVVLGRRKDRGKARENFEETAVTSQKIPYGSDASAGTFECVDCGERIDVQSKSSLPPCPNDDGRHSSKAWRAISGEGDAPRDPHPQRS